MGVCYIYKNINASAEMTLFSAEDRNAEDYRDLLKKIGAFEMLYLSQKHHAHPFGHKESKAEAEARLQFDIEKWHLVAAIFDPNHREGFSSALLIHKELESFAIVVELTGFQITDSIFGEWAVEDEFHEIESMQEVLDFFGIKKQPASPQPKVVAAKEEPTIIAPTFEPVRKGGIQKIVFQGDAKSHVGQTFDDQEDASTYDEEDTPISIHVETPSFVANSSKKPRNLDAITPAKPVSISKRTEPSSDSSPAFSPSNNKKPRDLNQDFPKIGHPKKIDKIEKKEESTAPIKESSTVEPASIEYPRFVANSSKKPKNLDGISPAKPVQISKQDVKPESPSSSFAPSSNKKPKNLDQPQSRWQEVSLIRLLPDRKSPNCRTLVFDRKDERIVGIFDAARRKLETLDTLQLTSSCIFSPSLPEGSLWKRALKQFQADRWNILALNVDAYNRPTAFVLSDAAQPEFCLIVLPNGRILSIGFNGVCVHAPYHSFEDLLKALEEPEETLEPSSGPMAEEKAPEDQPEPRDDEAASEEEEERPLIPRRRVFVTNAFLKAQDRFARKYHMAAEHDFEDVVKTLIVSDDDELTAFLKGHDSKPIRTEHGVTILKMRFGSSADYAASRLFYCRGYDLQRKMDANDILLLGVSDQGEHEEQGEVSRLFARMFEPKKGLLLYQKLLPIHKDADLDQLAYMSSKQFSYLDDARLAMPMAFLGSAGTGKTLISLQHYLSLLEEGKKVLYLTYQKALCDEVRKTLKELRADNVEAMTYRDLCFSILGEERASAMRTKKRFRRWFINYASKTGSAQTKLREVAPNIEDQFMICYVFYRGIIDGSRKEYKTRRGAILSKEQFLAAVRQEKGFSQKAKEVVYDVALAYEKHLAHYAGTTDNKLAYEILAMGKKAQRYDAVVIDEFQDLSEIQFMAVVSLLKVSYPLPLFIYGDENQAINPTIFNFKNTQQILFEMFKKDIRFKVTELNDSFRSGPNLVHYINDVNKVKRLAIGARSQQEELEVSLREDEEDLFATLVEGEDNLKELLKICSRSEKDVVFIFPSATRREKAEKQFSSILGEGFVHSSFLSVEEAKGREWDSVVLVDFFSSSKELFDAMLGEDRVGHHSTIHRMLFNRFYVALTRAQNRIVVYESDASDLIRKKLLKGLLTLPSLKQLEDYFQGGASDEAWSQFGDKLMHSRRYSAAYKAFLRTEGEEAKEKAELCLRYIKAEHDELSYEEARDLYLEQLDYEYLSDLYEEMGYHDRATFLDMARDRTDASYVLEAYQALEKDLSVLEKKVFFTLCCRKLLQRIEGLRSKLWRRLP